MIEQYLFLLIYLVSSLSLIAQLYDIAKGSKNKEK